MKKATEERGNKEKEWKKNGKLVTTGDIPRVHQGASSLLRAPQRRERWTDSSSGTQGSVRSRRRSLGTMKTMSAWFSDLRPWEDLLVAELKCYSRELLRLIPPPLQPITLVGIGQPATKRDKMVLITTRIHLNNLDVPHRDREGGD